MSEHRFATSKHSNKMFKKNSKKLYSVPNMDNFLELQSNKTKCNKKILQTSINANVEFSMFCKKMLTLYNTLNWY